MRGQGHLVWYQRRNKQHQRLDLFFGSSKEDGGKREFYKWEKGEMGEKRGLVFNIFNEMKSTVQLCPLLFIKIS